MKLRLLPMLLTLSSLAFSAQAFAAAEGVENTTTPATQAVAPADHGHAHDAAGGHAAGGAAHGAGHAAGAHEEPDLLKPDLGSAIVTVVIFAILLIVLGKFAWKPILAGLKTREQAIRDSVEAAAKAKLDAEKAGRELEAKISEVQRQAAQQLAQAKADAQKLADSIKTQAEAESIALKDRALKDIEAAKAQALSEINTHAADLGMAVAKRILQRNVTADDQNRLVEESLAEIARKN